MSQADTPSVELFLDHTCPWSYMAFRAAGRLAVERAVGPRWRLLPIVGARPGSAADRAMQQQRMVAEWPAVAQAASDFGLRLDRPEQVASGEPAARLVSWLRQAGLDGEAALHEALFQACFVGGLAVDCPEVLISLAARTIGAAPPAPALAPDRDPPALATDVEAAERLGVTAVPTFVLAGSHLLLGAETAEVLVQAFDQLRIAQQLAAAGASG